MLMFGALLLGAQAAFAQYSGEVTSSNISDPEFNFIGFGDISYLSRD